MLEAIVLAGGFGTRLRESVPNLPKSMAPICGKPFLEILLRLLANKGFTRVVLSLGYMAERILSYFGEHFAGMDIVYVVENQPLGTGGAVRLAMDKCIQDHVFIFNGDTFLDLEIVALENHWLTRRQPIIVGRQVLDTTRYGRLLVQDGIVKGFIEKGVAGPGLINAGSYVFSRTQLDSFQINQPFSLETDFLASAFRSMQIDVFVTTGQFIDIGVPEDYRQAQTDLLLR